MGGITNRGGDCVKMTQGDLSPRGSVKWNGPLSLSGPRALLSNGSEMLVIVFMCFLAAMPPSGSHDKTVRGHGEAVKVLDNLLVLVGMRVRR